MKKEILGALALVVILPALAHASGSGLPWEGPLQPILDSISGPVAKVIGVLAIVLTGLGWPSAKAADS